MRINKMRHSQRQIHKAMKSKRSMRQRYKARVEFATIFYIGCTIITGKKSLVDLLSGQDIEHARKLINEYINNEVETVN